MGAFLLGKDAKLYSCATNLDGLTGAGGATNTPTLATWVEQSNIIDLDANYSTEKIDTTTRATAQNGWGTEEVVFKTAEVSFGVPVKSDPDSDTFLAALLSAWQNNTLIALLPATGDIDTVQGHMGLAANYSIEMSLTQPLRDRQVWSVTATPAEYPEIYTSPAPA